MSIHKWSLLFCAILFFSLAPSAYPQLQQAAQQHAPALRMGRYDKSAEVVASGTIASIQSSKSATLPRGAYIALRSGALTLNVHMGLFSPPSIPFPVGEQVQVTGSLISMNGTQLLLARQVQSASHTLTVRSSNGFVLRPHPAAHMQTLSQGFQQ
ncbi:MAG TPA: hypothetical protein VG322_14360 [Candidatus Acidoferrales bacterium]|jgi:hypothetical protein|nr:hypothetical protein [Candidatus Acidoferrales bacterium]